MKKLFDNKIFKILFGIIKFLFVAVIVLYLLFILVQRFSGNKSVFGYRVFTVATGSMSGVYEINDVIAVRDCDVHKLKVGDDVAYQGNRGGYEGMLITHRIIEIEKDDETGELLFTTKGVNSPAADPSISETQILGKVVGIVPFISLLNHVVKSQLGFFLLIFCPLVLVIVLEVLQTITEIQVEKNEIRYVEHEPKENETVEKEEKFTLKSSWKKHKEKEHEEKIDSEVVLNRDFFEENHEEKEEEKKDDNSKKLENTDFFTPVIREVIEISDDEDNRRTESYVDIPTVEEEKEKKDDIIIV